ncbi:MAG: hypothetical protein GF393_11360, partial [Armatimonadia bacterium]|nr:hypothetical protein [Armatimonadia bacterium]
MTARTVTLLFALMPFTTAAVAQETTVSDAILTPREVVQGEVLEISWTLTARGDDISATTFLLPGSVETPPDEWADSAIRTTSRYQVTHEALTGEPTSERGTLPGGRTAAMRPGPWTAFVAVLGAGEGWEYFRLGEITIADASLVPLPERDGPAPVAILADALPTSGTASDPERVAALVRRAGCAATLLSAGDLADPATFSRERFDLLVLPTGGAVPEQATEAIAQFMAQAGALISLGGPALTEILPAGGGADGRTVTVADFEGEDALETLDIIRGATSEGELSVAGDGADGTAHALKLSIEHLQDWFYVDVPLSDVANEDLGCVNFHARGDENAEALCLELIARDGSRWKYFVELDPRWRAYSVRLSDFAFYHGEGRGNPGDRFDPAEAQSLKLGFYRALH